MIPSSGMPHPWWMFWQIGDFLVMATLVALFVRYVLRSGRSQEAEPSPPDAEDAAESDAEPPSARR